MTKLHEPTELTASEEAGVTRIITPAVHVNVTHQRFAMSVQTADGTMLLKPTAHAATSTGRSV